MKKIDWVLFDLGGVLVKVDQARIFAKLAQSTGLSPSAIQTTLLDQTPLNTRFVVEEYLPSRITIEINSALGTSLSEKEVVSAINSELGETISSTAGILPGLRPKVKIGCLSNTNSIHWDQLLQAYDFMSVFDRRFASQILGEAKPGSAIYRAVSELLGVGPSQILFFDDREENVEAANRLGWHARVYRNHEGLQADLKEFGLWS